MNDCVFCKIVSKEIPAHVVYEDAKFLAFLDIHPQTPGHVQIIPKEHHRWVWDVLDAGSYFEVARAIALAERKAFGTDFVLSRIVGDEVPHAHIWVFPSNEAAGDKMDFEANKKKLIEALKS
jgi:histidine triad (HIT) family protein